MKTLLPGLLAATLCASPVAAADFPPAPFGANAAGAFAGARVRIKLGAKAGPKLRMSLALAPMTRASGEGRVAFHFGEGLAFGGGAGTAPGLSIAGRPLSAFSPRRASVDKTRASGVSTLGWVAIGVGAAVIIVLAAGVACQETNCLNSD